VSAAGTWLRTVVRRGSSAAIVALLLAPGSAALAQGPSAPGPAPLQATLERLGGFYNAGDPILVRVAVFNTGTTPFENTKGIDLLGSLVVSETSGSQALARKPSPTADARLQPSRIPGGGFFGVIADLRQVFDGLDKPGRYSARFVMGDLTSESVDLVLIQRYDTSTAYQATLETDYGKIVFDLLGQQAPRHVQNFHDLANQGFYDGSVIHFVAKGIEMRGGDRAGDGSTDPGFGLPFEIVPTLRHQRGALSMMRGQNADHGSQFMISLAENPAADGKMTIFGAMAGGEETLAAIENLPTTGQREYPYYRPVKDVRIHSIRVSAAAPGSKATTESAAAKAPSAP